MPNVQPDPLSLEPVIGRVLELQGLSPQDTSAQAEAVRHAIRTAAPELAKKVVREPAPLSQPDLETAVRTAVSYLGGDGAINPTAALDALRLALPDRP